MSSEGKVAIVTGAARGIGQGYAVTLAKDGFAVTVTDLRDCDETVKLVKAVGGKVLAMADQAGLWAHRRAGEQCGGVRQSQRRQV